MIEKHLTSHGFCFLSLVSRWLEATHPGHRCGGGCAVLAMQHLSLLPVLPPSGGSVSARVLCQLCHCLSPSKINSLPGLFICDQGTSGQALWKEVSSYLTSLTLQFPFTQFLTSMTYINLGCYII